MANLFDAIARHRPEWLAQGLFMRAVSTEPGVRALLLEKLGWGLSADEVPELKEEVVTEVGWRADVCVTWKEHRRAHMELKLLAGFTARQKEALKSQKVDLVVVPSLEDRKLPDGLPSLTWKEIAAQVEGDHALKQLLEEVCASSTWMLDAPLLVEIQTDFDSFFRERVNSGWSRMYRFLSTVHLHLREGAAEYRASDNWSFSRRSQEPYYGFCFWLDDAEVPWFWLGFWQDKKTNRPVFGLTASSACGKPVLFEESERFSAKPLAARVLAMARQHLDGVR